MIRQRTFEHRLFNTLQSLLLLGALAALAGYLGWTLLGTPGLWATALGPLLAILGRGVSPRMVLRLSGGWEIAPHQAPALYRLAARLAQRAQLASTPRLYYVPTRMLNAFAVGGRNDPAIAVTDGLLHSLDVREIAGVLAHEIAHVRANDVWVMTLADVVARMTVLFSFIGQMLLVVLLPAALMSNYALPILPLALLIFAPGVASLLQLALSRTREFAADITAVDLTDDPRGLASALSKLERFQGGWIERMFMARVPKWLRTHPQTAERIRRLLEMEREREASYEESSHDSNPLFERPTVVHAPRWHWPGLWY